MAIYIGPHEAFEYALFDVNPELFHVRRYTEEVPGILCRFNLRRYKYRANTEERHWQINDLQILGAWSEARVPEVMAIQIFRDYLNATLAPEERRRLQIAGERIPIELQPEEQLFGNPDLVVGINRPPQKG